MPKNKNKKNKKNKMTMTQAIIIGLMVPTIITSAAFGFKKLNKTHEPEPTPTPITEEVSYYENIGDVAQRGYVIFSEEGNSIEIQIVVVKSEPHDIIDSIHIKQYINGTINGKWIRDLDYPLEYDLTEYMEEIKEKYSYDSIKDKHFPEKAKEQGGL